MPDENNKASSKSRQPRENTNEGPKVSRLYSVRRSEIQLDTGVTRKHASQDVQRNPRSVSTAQCRPHTFWIKDAGQAFRITLFRSVRSESWPTVVVFNVRN